MKHKATLLLASLALVFSCGLISRQKNVSSVEAAQHIDNYSNYTYSGSYYSSAFSTYSEGLNGTLRTNLTTLIHPTSVPEYSSGLATHLQQADADPTNSSNMVYLYTRDSVKKNAASSWNREHVWPKALSNSCWQQSRAGADMLHLRPTYQTPNSTRGSLKYGEVTKNSTNLRRYNDEMDYGYLANNYFMPLDATKGDVARICMYIWVAYYNEYGSNLPSLTNVFQSFDVLMTWHTNDRPDVLEGNRNDYAQNNVQYNRNPFVDHPEYAWKIFGSQCSQSVLNAAKAAYPEGDPVGITSISKSSATIAVGETTTISAVSSNSGTISWTTSNSSVASLSTSSTASGANVTITGVAAGTATITAKATINGTQYSKTCTVTVTKVVSSLSKGSTSPTKTTYTAGESFDPTGLTITANYSDSTSGNVTSSVVWTPDPLTAGTTSVTGTFGGKTITISGLTVNAVAEPDSYSIVPTDLANGTYPTTATSYTAASGISVTAYNTANFSSKIQFKKSGGYLYNNSSLNLGTLTLSSVSGSLTVYAGTSKNPSSTTISGSNGVYDLSGYNYFKIINSSGSVATCSSITVELAAEEKTLSSISVSTAPAKTTYTAGEYFDPTGLVITRTYSDLTSDTYSYANHTSDFTFSPTTSTALTTSNVSVTITYGGKSTSQAITVNAAKTLSSISVSTTPTKVTYTAGEYFDPTGLVITRTYSDSTSDTYTYANHTSEFTFSPSTSTALTTSNASVTITYGGKSTSQAITVNAAAKTLSSISISGQTTSFSVDDTFSFGGTVTAHFSDSSTTDVTASATFSGYNMSVAGNYTVTVSYTYSGTTKTTTYSITVNSSGGSGGGTEEGSQRISASSTSIYYESGDIYPTGSTSSATATCDAFDVSWLKNSGSNSIAYTYAEIRIYASHSFTITPKDGYTITTIVITANSSSYASAVGGSSLTNCTKDVSNSIVTLTPTDGTSAVGFANSAQSRLNYIVVNYESESSGGTETPTSITASVSKTYYVGETISSSDITVKDNNNKTVSSFTFANNGYQFTYEDATSGGALTNKTFANSISGANLTCSLTVQVQRKAYATPSTNSLTHTGSEFSTAGIGSSYTTNQTATVDGITFTVDGYIYSSKLSLSSGKTSAPGKVINTTPYPGGITNVTVSGASPDIQLSTDGSTWVDLSSAQTSTNNYLYLKLFYKTTSQSNYVNITSFTVTHKAAETASNVANYVMYEDTSNQCTSKFSVAKGYFEAMSSAERSTFMTSTDYVIATARERLLAWAAHEGKTIQQSNGDYVVTTPTNILVQSIAETSGSVLIIVVVGLVAISAVGGYFFIKKRKEI